MPTIAANCTNVILRFFLIKASTIWMSSSVRYVDGRLDRLSSTKSYTTFVDSCFVPHTVHVIDFRRFCSCYPQKAPDGALFLDSVITEWSVHTSVTVAPYQSAERWNAARG